MASSSGVPVASACTRVSPLAGFKIGQVRPEELCTGRPASMPRSRGLWQELVHGEGLFACSPESAGWRLLIHLPITLLHC